MILYAIIAFVSVAGIALNGVMIANLGKVKDAEALAILPQIRNSMFFMIAFYGVLAAVAARFLVKKKYPKNILIVLAVILFASFAFKDYLLEFLFF